MIKGLICKAFEILLIIFPLCIGLHEGLKCRLPHLLSSVFSYTGNDNTLPTRHLKRYTWANQPIDAKYLSGQAQFSHKHFIYELRCGNWLAGSWCIITRVLTEPWTTPLTPFSPNPPYSLLIAAHFISHLNTRRIDTCSYTLAKHRALQLHEPWYMQIYTDRPNVLHRDFMNNLYDKMAFNNK